MNVETTPGASRKPHLFWMIGLTRFGTDHTGVPIEKWRLGDSFVVCEDNKSVVVGVFCSFQRSLGSALKYVEVEGFWGAAAERFCVKRAHGSIKHGAVAKITFAWPLAVADCEAVIRDCLVETSDFLNRYGEYEMSGPQLEMLGKLKGFVPNQSNELA